MGGRLLSRKEARSFYDWFGRLQDLQRIYEDPALDALIEHARFESAAAVVELGCGTGRLAERLLRERLPAAATYAALDISETMVALARTRVEPWRGRARVERVDGGTPLPLPDGSCDRFLSTYVLDLLPEPEIRAMLAEARRLTIAGGRLCLASLTFGRTTTSRAVCRLWQSIHSLSPRLVGGCRPIRLGDFIGPEWRTLHSEVVCTLGVCSEVLVAA